MKNNGNYVKKLLLLLFILLSNTGIASGPSAKRVIRVAVIDTGFDFKSTWKNAGKDSDGVALKRPKLCKEGHKDFTNTGIQDNHGHGTHVAGIIAKFAVDANYCLIIIKYYDSATVSSDNLSHTIKAFEYLSTLDVDMVNYSGGGLEFSMPEYRSIKKLLDNGVIFVAAAGNEKTKTDYKIFKIDEKNRKIYYNNTSTGQIVDRQPSGYYPADYDPRIIVVSNSKLDKNLGEMVVAPSSNHGDAINFQEKGTNVLSILPNNQRGYMTGTSQAAPTRLGKMLKMWNTK
jgi:subtilisin family serine protease